MLFGQIGEREYVFFQCCTLIGVHGRGCKGRRKWRGRLEVRPRLDGIGKTIKESLVEVVECSGRVTGRVELAHGRDVEERLALLRGSAMGHSVLRRSHGRLFAGGGVVRDNHVGDVS